MRIFAALLLVGVLAVIVNESILAPVPPPVSSIEDGDSLSPDDLSSPHAILIDLQNQTILMQKNSEEKIYPASLTKIMTAIVAIENLPDLNEEITLDPAMFRGLSEAGASMAGFQPGEDVRAIDLLYGAILPSGAESCIALADSVAGTESDFVRMMNRKAADLGMHNTHFENATGLHHENHYATVKDLAILLSYALQNDTFREIFTSSRHSTPPTNKHPDGIALHSSMFDNVHNESLVNGKILGGKTGYTDKAGRCLASLAEVGGEEYILITTGADVSERYHITDAFVAYNSIGKKGVGH